MVNRNFNTQTDLAVEGEEKAQEQQGRYFRPGELMTLDKTTLAEVTKLCKQGVESWQSSSETRQTNLRRWNDLLEGVMEEVDFPWEGSSNLHIPLIALHLVTLHSVMCRSILSVDPLWYGKSLDKEVRERVSDIEEGITYKAKAELNIVSACRDWLYNTVRDGLGWLQVTWAEESHQVETVIRVKSVEQFQAEYPTPEDAQLTPEAYAEVLEEISAKATSEVPHEIPVLKKQIDYKGPKGEVIDEADMVRAPYTAKDLKGCRVYGKRYYPRIQELQERADAGELWANAVKSFASKKNSTKMSAGSEDSWRRSRESIEGVKSDEGDFSDECEMYELIVRYKSKEEKRELLLLCTYSKVTNIVLGVVKYPYTRDCYLPARIIKRPGRMAGVAVPERLEGLNEEVDASIRHEINSDAIELSPIFKGKKGKNDDFDPALEENLVRPGVWWLFEEPKDFEQVLVRPTSKGASMERRQELMRVAEMLIGPTQLLSGKESPTDPNAPARKTIALIAQSNMRIEDYIVEFRGAPTEGFDGLGNLLVALYDQFGDEGMDFETRNGDVGKLDRTLLRKAPKMSMRGITAILNPDAEFEKAMQWYQILRKEPLIDQDPVKVRTLLSDLLISGRHPSRDALLPPKPEAEKMRDEMLMKQAEEKVIAGLIKKGIIQPPTPPPMPGIPGVSGSPLSQPGAPPPLPQPPLPGAPIQGGMNA